MRWAILGMVGVAIVLGAWLLRYELVPAGEAVRALPVVYILDRWTGQINRCWGSGGLSGCERDLLREEKPQALSSEKNKFSKLLREEQAKTSKANPPTISEECKSAGNLFEQVWCEEGRKMREQRQTK